MLCLAEDSRGYDLGTEAWELLPALAGSATSWGGGGQEGQLGRRWPGLKNPKPLRGPGQQLLGSSDKGPTCLFSSHFLNIYSRPVPVLHTGIKEKNETWALT